MATKQDVLEAKRVLSSRLLSPGIRNSVAALRGRTNRMAEVIAGLSANVHAVGIGRKIVDGRPTDTLAVRLYVLHKIATAAIPPRDLLPKELEGVPCDVIETPMAFVGARTGRTRRPATRPRSSVAAAQPCSAARRTRQRPFSAGISVAQRNVTAGTIGYFCRSTRSEDPPDAIYVLSNNHVLADVNLAPIGSDILQPGPADGGTFFDRIAELHRFVPITLGGAVANRVDAAIGLLTGEGQHVGSICSIGPVSGTARGMEDMPVVMHGRTTGLQQGVIDDESVDAFVGMDHNDPSLVAKFSGQLRIKQSGTPTFGQGGDSGSLVVTPEARKAVGLFFAGPPNGEYGLANQIADVLDDLKVALV